MAAPVVLENGAFVPRGTVVPEHLLFLLVQEDNSMDLLVNESNCRKAEHGNWKELPNVSKVSHIVPRRVRISGVTPPYVWCIPHLPEGVVIDKAQLQWRYKSVVNNQEVFEYARPNKSVTLNALGDGGSSEYRMRPPRPNQSHPSLLRLLASLPLPRPHPHPPTHPPTNTSPPTRGAAEFVVDPLFGCSLVPVWLLLD